MSRPDALFGIHVPTGSALERLPVGWTYLLALLVTVPAFVVRVWWLTGASLVVVILLLLTARLGRRALHLPWGLILLVAIMGGYQAYLGDPIGGAVLATNLVLAVFASRLLTMTKPVPVLLDAVVAAAGPLRWVGLSPERFGLAVSVMLRSVPYLAGAFGDVRDAARARGLERNPLAHLTPVVVRAVGYAQATGDALAARGLGDD